jgi:hypothetical protein
VRALATFFDARRRYLAVIIAAQREIARLEDI